MYLLFLRIDIDECVLGISGCSQTCTNTNGSFICSCINGYNLSSENQKTCNGNNWSKLYKAVCLYVLDSVF